jgi:hypothetical protein
MTTHETNEAIAETRSVFWIFSLFVLAGIGGFLLLLIFRQYERAWQTYLVNFLFWSAVAQGGLLFSMVMHVTRARWSRALENLSEAFVAFFPISFILFLVLFLGREHLFPWLHQDLHGKEVWLNLPFLFTRDLVGLVILYGSGFAYCHYAVKSKIDAEGGGIIRSILAKTGVFRPEDRERYRRRMTVTAVLYMFAYAWVLTLISFDLVMSMDPHFISTLFGGYFFIKAFYIGLGGVIITAAVVSLVYGDSSLLKPAHFHDIGKLFFAFCIVWAYFLYAQVLVIWYGNVPEDAHYLLNRIIPQPWKLLLVFVFITAFVIPFLTLLNMKAKTRPVLMLILCSIVLFGIWLENLLLIGPPLDFDIASLSLQIFDVLISLGFLGLMVMAVAYFLKLFPELVLKADQKVRQ